MNNDKLTEKQKLFADEYIKTLNGRESYRKAYNPKSADNVVDVNASQLLRRPKVKEYIDSRLKEIKKDRIASAQEVMEYLSSVMRGEIQEETIVVEGIGEGVSEARIINKHPTVKDRTKAGELLAKRYGLMTEKVEITEKVVQIIDDIK